MIAPYYIWSPDKLQNFEKEKRNELLLEGTQNLLFLILYHSTWAISSVTYLQAKLYLIYQRDGSLQFWKSFWEVDKSSSFNVKKQPFNQEVSLWPNHPYYVQYLSVFFQIIQIQIFTIYKMHIWVNSIFSFICIF